MTLGVENDQNSSGMKWLIKDYYIFKYIYIYKVLFRMNITGLIRDSAEVPARPQAGITLWFKMIIFLLFQNYYL